MRILKTGAFAAAADRHIDQQYDFEIEEGEPMILDYRPVVAAIVKDISRSRRAGKFPRVFTTR
jgi:hypothetical protein